MLRLKKEFLAQIICESKKEFPNEACGILAGKNQEVQKVCATTNIDKSPSSYFMDAKEQFKVMKELRNLGLDIVGIYHSHVKSQAYPSAHDVELAFYPDVSYVIVSLKDKDNPKVRSFKIRERQISEEKIKIE